jgi:hypothetical protein
MKPGAILSNNPNFIVARASAGARINDEIAALESDGSNGALQEDFTSGFFKQLSREFTLVLSFLLGGSWWKAGDAVEDENQSVTSITALRRVWKLIAPDKIRIICCIFCSIDGSCPCLNSCPFNCNLECLWGKGRSICSARVSLAAAL